MTPEWTGPEDLAVALASARADVRQKLLIGAGMAVAGTTLALLVHPNWHRRLSVGGLGLAGVVIGVLFLVIGARTWRLVAAAASIGPEGRPAHLTSILIRGVITGGRATPLRMLSLPPGTPPTVRLRWPGHSWRGGPKSFECDGIVYGPLTAGSVAVFLGPVGPFIGWVAAVPRWVSPAVLDATIPTE